MIASRIFTNGDMTSKGISEGPDCLLMDGQDSYVQTGLTVVPSSFTTFTIEANVIWDGSPIGTNGWRSFLGFKHSTEVQLGLGIRTPSGSVPPSIYFRHYVGSGDVRDYSTTQMPANTKVHLAIVYQSGTLILYMNGQSIGSYTANLQLTSNYPFCIGGTYLNRILSGKIWNVRVWNVARTSQQLYDNMDSYLTGSETGLIGYWPCDDGYGSSVGDLSNNSNHGVLPSTGKWDYTFNGPMTVTKDGLLKVRGEFSELPDCLVFDSTEENYQWVQPGQIANITFPFSFECWAYRNPIASTETYYILSLTRNASAYWTLAFNHNGFPIIQGRNTTTYDVAAPTSVSGDWVHLVGVFHSSTKRELIVNGVSENIDDSGRTANLPGGPYNFLIGRLRLSSSPQGVMRGRIKEVRIWDKIITPAEAKENMFKTFSGHEAHLLGYWPLDDGDGDVAHDKTTYKNNGVITGATWGHSFNGPLSIAQHGESIAVPNYLNFDGYDDHVEINDSPALKGFTAVSFEFWTRVDAINFVNDARLIEKSTGFGGEGGFVIGYEQGSMLKYLQAGAFTLEYRIPLGVNTHIAITITSTQLKLYVNGVLTHTLADPRLPASSTAKLRIGNASQQQDPGNRRHTGIMREVRIWNIELTEAQINANMNKFLNGNETGLVGYWPLNEGNGNIAYDKSPNGNNGIITSATWGQPSSTPLSRHPNIVSIRGEATISQQID